MKVKIIVRMVILFVVCFFFASFLVFGNLGIISYFDGKKEVVLGKEKIAKLERKITLLENEIKKFLEDDFELQRIAREDLQMGFADEKVYFLVDE